MSRTGCLRSWFRCCGAVALTAFFALNSTSVWAAQEIAAGTTVTGAEGTASNPLKIYGTANNSVITGGFNNIYSGGVANITTVNEGTLSVSSGGAANNTTVNGGTIFGERGSTIDGLVINKEGSFSFDTGMTLTNATLYGKEASIVDKVASGLTLDNDSYLSVSSGGAANNTTVNGGEIFGYGGSTIDGLVVDNEGSFDFNTGTTLTNAILYGKEASIVDNVASGLTLDNSSRLLVSSGGAANNTTVNGGELYVKGGGTAKDTTVNGGYIYGYSGSTIDGLVVDNEGSFDFNTGTTLTNAILYGKEASIVDNVASGLTLDNSSRLTVSGGDTANTTTVNGGNLYLEGGRANGVLFKGGKLTSRWSSYSDIELDINGSLGAVDGRDTNTMILSGNVTNGHLYFQDKDSEGGLPIEIVNSTFKNNSSSLFEDITDFQEVLLYGRGGAITAISNALKIIADDGTTEFSGNYVNVKNEDGTITKKSNAISLFSATLNVEAKNNGKVIFNDGISGGDGKYFIDNMIKTEEGGCFDEDYNFLGQNGDVEEISNDDYEKMKADIAQMDSEAKWSEDGTKVYFFDENGHYHKIAFEPKENNEGYIQTHGVGYYVYKKPYGYIVQVESNKEVVPEDFYFSFIQNPESLFGEGYDVEFNDEMTEAMISVGAYTAILRFTPLNDESNQYMLENISGIKLGGEKISITGDESGTVYFNDEISNISQIALSDTNVIFGGKSKINGFVFKANSGSVNNAVIESGGELILEAASKAKDMVVELGGKLVAKAAAVVENMTAKAQSILEVDQDAVLKGDIVIDKDADVSGSSYDFSQMFSNTNLDVDSLTVVGGINDAFVKDEVSKLVNEDTAKDKGLTLEGGEYSLANVIKEGSTQVAGWDVINIKATESAPATIVKLETDIELVGSNKEMNIGEGAVLDVSGHSPLEITIDGNVTNSGTMDFTIYDNDGEADDIITIAGDYRAAPGALIVLNVEPEKNRADKMVVQGDVIGNTNVFLKSNSEKEPTAEILFAEVPNDDEATASGFDIWRVEGSPFAWDTKKEDGKWYTYIDGLLPPTSGGDGKPDMSQIRKLTGEMIAYMGLYDAGFEQTASLNRVIAENVGKNQLLGKGCRGTLCREINPVRNAWVAPVHQNLEIDAPYKYEAKISGIDAGIDINSDGINKWGILASYRKGNYEFDGSGDKYYSDEGSEIDIESYVMGLYFRRDKYNTKIAGTIYAGMQEAEISSDDGAKAKTDALEVGASLDVSHIFEITKDITIAPELQISYQMLDYDNIKDNAGKKVQLEAAHRITAEAGAKLEKKWTLDEGKAAIYVKPSVIQTIHGGGKLNVKALDSIHTTEDRTLGRFEIGAEYEVNTRWSVGASAAHTFGSDYKDTTFSLDAKYRF